MPEERRRQSYTGRPATLADHEQNEFKVQPICRVGISGLSFRRASLLTGSGYQ